jgi:hypothetical protein
VPVVEGIRRAAASVGAAAHYAVSNSGVLIYVPGSIRAGEETSSSPIGRAMSHR